MAWMLPQLDPEYWVIIMFCLVLYFYIFINMIMRRNYLRVCHLFDGNIMEILDCTKSGNQLSFHAEKIRKLFGVIPLGRRQVKGMTTKGISAEPRVWIQGPRTFTVYFTSYNSPVTINPTGGLTRRGELSLGHDIVEPTLRAVSRAGSSATKRDYLLMALFVVVGVLLDIILRNFGINLGGT